jgi:hypothetical protein
MDSLNDEAVASGVVMYLILFALLVGGGVAIHIGYRVFGVVLIVGAGALLAALAAGLFG